MNEEIRRYCPDELWDIAEPLVPPVPPRHQGGGRRRKVPDRAVLAALIYLDRTGCSWRDLPKAFGVARSTGHDRFTAWTRAGFWDDLLHAIHNRLGTSAAIDWSRAAIDSISIRAKSGGDHTGPSPVDRGKPGTKIHATVDRNGLPLSVQISGANVHDKRLLERTVDQIHPIRQRFGRPRRRPVNTPTRATTTTTAAPPSGRAGSSPGSPAKASNRPSASDATDGWSNAPSPG